MVESKGEQDPVIIGTTGKLNWKKILPFGTHLRETINDIQIIRSSFKRGPEKVNATKEAHAKQ